MASDNSAINSTIHNTNRNAGGPSSSTTSEKMQLANLRFSIGDTIMYGDDMAKPQFAVKVGQKSYIDLRTKRPILERNIARFLSDTAKSKRASFSDIEKSSPVVSKMLNQSRKPLMVDFETTFAASEAFKKSDVLSIGLTEVKGTGRSAVLKNKEFFVTDIFQEMISDNKQTSASAYARYAEIGKGMKTAMYGALSSTSNFNIKRFENRPADEALDYIVSSKEKLKGLLKGMNQLEDVSSSLSDADRNAYKKLTNEMGVGSYTANTYLTDSKTLGKILRNEYGLTGDEGRQVLAFNPAGRDDDALAALIGKDSAAKISMGDVRGSQLFINSTVMPQLTENLHQTLGPQLNNVVHRLRLNNDQRKVFFDSLKQGISGIYSTNSSAEAFEKNLRYALGYGQSGETAHRAMMDTARQTMVHKMQGEFVDRSIKETLDPNMYKTSVRARYASAFIMDKLADAKAHNNMMINKDNYGTNWKAALLDDIHKTVNIKDFEKTIQHNFERKMNERIEKGFLQSNIQQFGGSTVTHLLGGALLFSGIQGAVTKLKENFMESKDRNFEGLSHESIPTVLRRLALSDFGSPWSAFSIAAMKTTKALFQELGAESSTGAASIVRKHLGNINQSIKNMKDDSNKSFFSLLMNPKKVQEMRDSILRVSRPEEANPRAGILENMFNELNSAGSIGARTRDTFRSATKSANDLAAIFQAQMEKVGTNPGSANKKIRSFMERDINKLFLNKDTGKVNAAGVALGLGGLGGLSIMLSRGKYDHEEMDRPRETKHDQKYARKENNWARVKHSVRDIRNASHEGIALGSQERQANRYRYTDFGSGWRGVLRFDKLFLKVENMSKGTMKVAEDSVATTTKDIQQYSVARATNKNLQKGMKNTVPTRKPRGREGNLVYDKTSLTETKAKFARDEIKGKQKRIRSERTAEYNSNEIQKSITPRKYVETDGIDIKSKSSESVSASSYMKRLLGIAPETTRGMKSKLDTPDIEPGHGNRPKYAADRSVSPPNKVPNYQERQGNKSVAFGTLDTKPGHTSILKQEDYNKSAPGNAIPDHMKFGADPRPAQKTVNPKPSEPIIHSGLGKTEAAPTVNVPKRGGFRAPVVPVRNNQMQRQKLMDDADLMSSQLAMYGAKKRDKVPHGSLSIPFR